MTDAASLPRIIKQAARNGSLDLLRKLRDESCQIVTDLIEREVGHEARIGLRIERHALAGGDAQALKLILVGLGDIVSAPALAVSRNTRRYAHSMEMLATRSR